MVATWTTEKLPRFETAIRKLTEQHRQLKDQPLYLAIVYGSHRDPQDIFLLEVIGSSDEDNVSPDRELFETVFSPTPGFPMDLDQSLHLILTNPHELKTALREHWHSASEIINAMRKENYHVIFADNKVGKPLLKVMRELAKSRNGDNHG